MSFEHLSGFNSINNILKAQQRQADAVRALIEGPVHVAKALAAIPATIEKMCTQYNRLAQSVAFPSPRASRLTPYIPFESPVLDAKDREIRRLKHELSVTNDTNNTLLKRLRDHERLLFALAYTSEWELS